MLNNNPALFPVEDNGFAPPESGGSVGVVAFQVTFDNPSTSINLPDNIIPVGLLVSVVEDFTAGTDNDLDVGYDADGNYFIDALDIGTQGNFREDSFVAGRYGVKLGSSAVLTADYTESGTAADAGIANIILFYILAGDTVVVS